MTRLSIFDLLPNTGQINGLPANPRDFPPEKLDELIQSLRDDPEMLELRPLLVYPYRKKYVVLAGNMRLKAAEKLLIDELPCIVVPDGTHPDKLKAILIKDNLSYGKWDWEMIHADWDVQVLEDWGMDIMPLSAEDDSEDTPPDNTITNKLKVVVTCVTPEVAQDLAHEMERRGFGVDLK